MKAPEDLLGMDDVDEAPHAEPLMDDVEDDDEDDDEDDGGLANYAVGGDDTDDDDDDHELTTYKLHSPMADSADLDDVQRMVQEKLERAMQNEPQRVIKGIDSSGKVLSSPVDQAAVAAEPKGDDFKEMQPIHGDQVLDHRRGFFEAALNGPNIFTKAFWVKQKRPQGMKGMRALAG